MDKGVAGEAEADAGAMDWEFCLSQWQRLELQFRHPPEHGKYKV
jgi:hypothetical protein